MFKKITFFIKKHELLVVFVSLLLVTLLAYGKTLNMYWWVDDWGLAYKMLFPEETPGNLGAGIFGSGAYRYLATPFIYLYPIFKLNAQAYFLLGLIQYVIASLLVYLFIKEITNRKNIAFGSAVIFASGYIGSYALYRLSNSYQLIETTIFMILTSWMLIKHHNTNRYLYYYLSIIFYIIVLEFFFLRSGGIILTTIATSFLYLFSRNKNKLSLQFIAKLIPFVVIYLYFYFYGYLGGRESGGLGSSGFLSSTINTIFIQKHFELLGNFFITLTNAIFPRPVAMVFVDNVSALIIILTQKYLNIINVEAYLTKILLLVQFVLSISIYTILSKKKKITLFVGYILIFLFQLFIFWLENVRSNLWSPNKYDMFIAGISGNFLVILTLLTWFNRKKISENIVMIWFGLSWVVANFVIYYIYTPYTNLDSSSRYIVSSLVGTSLVLASILAALKNKYLYIVLIGVISATFLILTNIDENEIIKYTSLPDKQGYELIKKEVPFVNRETTFFVETYEDPRYKNFLGGIPALGIPSLFNYHGEVVFPESYDHLFYKLSSETSKLNNTYTFFFGKDGYVNTTNDFRKFITFGQPIQFLNTWRSTTPSKQRPSGIETSTIISSREEGSVGVNPIIYIDTNYSSIVPSLLTLKMKIAPLSILTYPYFDFSKSFSYGVDNDVLKNISLPTKIDIDEKDLQLALILEEEYQTYLTNVKVKTTSEWKTTESRYLIDGRSDNTWGAHNTSWNSEIRPENIILDLGLNKNIRKLIWINNNINSTPTDYLISYSLDKKNWTVVKEVKNGKGVEGGKSMVEELPIIRTRFIKMSINDTYRGVGYPPSIREMWVSEYGDILDMDMQDKLVSCPYCYIANINVANNVLAVERKIAKARVWWITDRNDNYYEPYSQDVQIFLDGKEHEYKILLPAHGSILKNIKIDGFPLPVNISINNASIKSLSLKEMEQIGAIKAFAAEDIRQTMPKNLE